MNALPSPEPERTYRWIPDAAEHAALVDKLRCGPPEPRGAVEMAVSHWPGTLLGVVLIICAGVLLMAGAAAIGG
jgi:hypothetical protein